MQEDKNGKQKPQQQEGNLLERLKRARRERARKIVEQEGGMSAQAERRIEEEIGEDVTRDEGTGQR